MYATQSIPKAVTDQATGMLGARSAVTPWHQAEVYPTKCFHVVFRVGTPRCWSKTEPACEPEWAAMARVAELLGSERENDPKVGAPGRGRRAQTGKRHSQVSIDFLAAKPDPATAMIVRFINENRHSRLRRLRSGRRVDLRSARRARREDRPIELLRDRCPPTSGREIRDQNLQRRRWRLPKSSEGWPGFLSLQLTGHFTTLPVSPVKIMTVSHRISFKHCSSRQPQTCSAVGPIAQGSVVTLLRSFK